MKHVGAACGFGNRPVQALLMTALLVLTSGCTFVKKITPGVSAEPTHSVRSIDISSTKNVNQDTAVGVDIVFVFDEKLVDTLPAMTARNWFREKPGYLARYPQSLAVFNYELVPIDKVDPVIKVDSLKTATTPAPKKARAVVLFANYLVENKAYTLDLSGFRHPIVSLEETTISVREKSGKSKKE
jgi:hypothetical protein